MLCCVVVGIIVYLVVEWWRRKPMLTDVTKRPVFITGCDSGFGRALAKRLDGQGTPVFAACYTEEGGRTLAEESSDRLTTLQLDVASTESIETARDFVKANLPEGKELWGIVNNAGIGGDGGPLEWMTRQSYMEVYQVNVIGMAEVCRLFLPLLKKSRGRIVNVTSSIAFNPFPGTLAYCTSKFAAEGLGDCLRRELWLWGVSVHLIEPGMFKTEITNADRFSSKSEAIWNRLPQNVKDEYGEEYIKTSRRVLNAAVDKGAAKDLSPVANSMVHALFAVNPRHRYLPGFDGKLAYVSGCLPATISDWLLRLMMKGSPKPISACNP